MHEAGPNGAEMPNFPASSLKLNLKPILLWLRNDLRLHDHAALQAAFVAATRLGVGIVPVYVWDASNWALTHTFGKRFGIVKTGPHRTRFLIESLHNLNAALHGIGSRLIIRLGKPEAAIPTLARELQASAVYYHIEATREETDVEAALVKALQPLGVALHGIWGHTLLHPDDLPFDTAHLPDVFTEFRRSVETQVLVRPPLATPNHIPAPLTWPASEPLPPLPIPQGPYSGGETEGLQRLQHYLWTSDLLRSYKETRNGMLGLDYSSKLSPWLANGCLSPRQVYAEVKRYERERVKNDSTYWLVFELLWRDYFRFVALKQGNALFRMAGLRNLPMPWRTDADRLEGWRNGNTGYPLVDAAMRELAATGYLGNRARQIAASFLTKNLGLDWRLGAEWFESQLVDYDVTSNYGNWQYAAGIGNDARGFRYFDIPRQAAQYDPEGQYVKHWLPVLASLPAARVHQPGMLSPAEQERYGIRLGADYPLPVVDLAASVQEQEKNYQAAEQHPKHKLGNYKLRKMMRRRE